MKVVEFRDSNGAVETALRCDRHAENLKVGEELEPGVFIVECSAIEPTTAPGAKLTCGICEIIRRAREAEAGRGEA